MQMNRNTNTDMNLETGQDKTFQQTNRDFFAFDDIIIVSLRDAILCQNG